MLLLVAQADMMFALLTSQTKQHPASASSKCPWQQDDIQLMPAAVASTASQLAGGLVHTQPWTWQQHVWL
jgi:hypothetical protein